MTDKLLARAEDVVLEFASIEEQLSLAASGQDNIKLRELSRKRSGMEELVATANRYRETVKELAEVRELLAPGSNDAEMTAMAEEDAARLELELEKITSEFRRKLLPRDPLDEKNILVEIRAGTGGEEAALFCADLYRMYSRYAETQGFRTEFISSNETGIGGYKEIVFSIEGNGAYSRFKFEGGVHRVQRVPATEAQGRIHTSASTVAVLPEPDEVEIKIDPTEIRVDVFRSGGPGGQSVNTTDSAVRLTHIPTGLVVSCQDEKSQLKNKNKALRVLRARLLEQEQEKNQKEMANARKSMVGSGDRSERIRTYNFPQGRVTDHRIELTLYDLDNILSGDIERIVEALQLADEEMKLKQQGVARH